MAAHAGNALFHDSSSVALAARVSGELRVSGLKCQERPTNSFTPKFCVNRYTEGQNLYGNRHSGARKDSKGFCPRGPSCIMPGGLESPHAYCQQRTLPTPTNLHFCKCSGGEVARQSIGLELRKRNPAFYAPLSHCPIGSASKSLSTPCTPASPSPFFTGGSVPSLTAPGTRAAGHAPGHMQPTARSQPLWGLGQIISLQFSHALTL